jgi:hypothetical protein
VKIDIHEIIDFLDSKKSSRFSNVIVQLLGEELGAHCFRLYIKETSSSTKVTIDSKTPCKNPEKKGYQLDRWILTEDPTGKKRLYQTEIKTWNSNGIGGKPISLTASVEELSIYGVKEWNQKWNSAEGRFYDKKVNKCLSHMNPVRITGSDAYDHQALLIYWAPFFNFPIKSIFEGILSRQSFVDSRHPQFNELTIFSVSMFLRHWHFGKKERYIDLSSDDFERTRETIRHLKNIVREESGSGEFDPKTVFKT